MIQCRALPLVCLSVSCGVVLRGALCVRVELARRIYLGGVSSVAGAPAATDERPPSLKAGNG